MIGVTGRGAAHSLGNLHLGRRHGGSSGRPKRGTALELEWQPDPKHRLQFGALFSRQELAVNSALPLDTRATDTMAMNLEYDWAGSDQTDCYPVWCRTHGSHLDTGVAPPGLVTCRRPDLSLGRGSFLARHERRRR